LSEKERNKQEMAEVPLKQFFKKRIRDKPTPPDEITPETETGAPDQPDSSPDHTAHETQSAQPADAAHSAGTVSMIQNPEEI